MTLLHHAAVKDQNVIFRKLLRIAKTRALSHEKYKSDPDIIKRWVNRQTCDEEFSAIHYSSFNGNIEICQMLIDEGCDYMVQNKHGLNCLHIAA